MLPLLGFVLRTLLQIGGDMWARVLAEHARLDRPTGVASVLTEEGKFAVLVCFVEREACVPNWLAKRIAQAAHLYARLLDERNHPVPF